MFGRLAVGRAVGSGWQLVVQRPLVLQRHNQVPAVGLEYLQSHDVFLLQVGQGCLHSRGVDLRFLNTSHFDATSKCSPRYMHRLHALWARARKSFPRRFFWVASQSVPKGLRHDPIIVPSTSIGVLDIPPGAGRITGGIMTGT